jgi:RNA-directed DNA polymerase
MEAVVERGNMQLAYERVAANKGAAGVDDLPVAELKDHLKRHWPTIRARLLDGTYQPQAVRGVDIPKPQGGVRTLGIPTVVDRLIQQAVHQVLQPIFEPTFSAASYGFRPLRRARQYVASGKRWVVDMDLEKFFDRVNHDLLMGKLAQRIGDQRVLVLIRRYLRGWAAYFKLAASKRALEERDGWIRHQLRCVLWRQWKRPYARARNLMTRGLTAERAWRSATNGRGPWWNAGASHMHAAVPTAALRSLGLLSLLAESQRLQRVS